MTIVNLEFDHKNYEELIAWQEATVNEIMDMMMPIRRVRNLPYTESWPLVKAITDKVMRELLANSELPDGVREFIEREATA